MYSWLYFPSSDAECQDLALGKTIIVQNRQAADNSLADRNRPAFASVVGARVTAKGPRPLPVRLSILELALRSSGINGLELGTLTG